MTTLMQQGNRKCTARCYNAKHPKCYCICGGENHGTKTFINIHGEKNIEQSCRTLDIKPDGLIIGNFSTRDVYIDGQNLSPSRSQRVRNHSPDGFMWGYGGSGPAQLALAILLEITDQKTAQALYQQFKWEVIALLPQELHFTLPVKTVIDWVEEHRAQLQLKWGNNMRRHTGKGTMKC